jgi:hypothetical protein
MTDNRLLESTAEKLHFVPGLPWNPGAPNHFPESGFSLRYARNDGPFIVPNDKNLNIELKKILIGNRVGTDKKIMS